jgi:hypothetical protein
MSINWRGKTERNKCNNKQRDKKNKERLEFYKSNVKKLSGKFLRVEGVAWSAQRIPTSINLSFLDRSRYFIIQVAPQLSSRGWVDPLPLRKHGRAENRTRDLWICSQKLWPLDHRGGYKSNASVTYYLFDIYVYKMCMCLHILWCLVAHVSFTLKMYTRKQRKWLQRKRRGSGCRLQVLPRHMFPVV